MNGLTHIERAIVSLAIMVGLLAIVVFCHSCDLENLNRLTCGKHRCEDKAQP